MLMLIMMVQSEVILGGVVEVQGLQKQQTHSFNSFSNKFKLFSC
jgi:hypothetical protein